VDANEFAKAVTQGAPAARQLRIEVKVYERKREAGVAGERMPPWGTFRLRNTLVLNDAAIKWERISGNNGEAITVHAGGEAEPTLEEVDPRGRVN